LGRLRHSNTAFQQSASFDEKRLTSRFAPLKLCRWRSASLEGAGEEHYHSSAEFGVKIEF